MAEIGDYSDPEVRNSNFLERIEDIAAKENEGWSQLELKKQEEDIPPIEEEQEEEKKMKKEKKHGRKEKNNARHDCCTGEEV